MRQALTGSRQGDHRAVQISALGEIYRGAAEDPDRQNPALSAAAKPRCFVRRHERALGSNGKPVRCFPYADQKRHVMGGIQKPPGRFVATLKAPESKTG